MLVRPPGVKYLPDAKPGVPYIPPKQEGKHQEDTGKGSFQFTGAVEMIGVYVPGGLPYDGGSGAGALHPERFGPGLPDALHGERKGGRRPQPHRVHFRQGAAQGAGGEYLRGEHRTCTFRRARPITR